MTLAIPTADIVQAFQRGESMASLARVYGCAETTIVYRLKQAGVHSRQREQVNARRMLSVHKPVLLGLKAQLEKALETVRAQFAADAGNLDKRQKYLMRIERLEEQIFALHEVTRR